VKQLFTLIVILILAFFNSKGQSLIISELCDPVNKITTNRYIEIYNPSCNPININGYSVIAISNNTECHTWTLTGTINPGEALVCGSSTPDGFTVDFPGGSEWDPSNSNCRFNWNGQARDGVILKDASNNLIDNVIIGTTSTPAYFADKSFYRKSTIESGSLITDTNQWSSNPADEFGTPGTHNHTLNCCSEPTAGPSLLNKLEGDTSVTLIFDKNGNDNLLIQWSTNSSFDLLLPLDNIAPPSFSQKFLSSGDQWVYAGKADTVKISGLDGCKKYFFKAWAYNCSGANTKYYESSSVSDTIKTHSLIAGTANTFSAFNTSANSTELRWNEPLSTCEGYVVKIRLTDSLFSNISTLLPSGNNEPWDDEDVIFTGSKQTFMVISGLKEKTKYFFKVYPYTSCEGIYTFNNNNNQIIAINTEEEIKPLSVCEGDTMKLSVAISNNESVQYQWKMLNPEIDTFESINNGGAYFGTNTPTLSIYPASVTMNGFSYTCQITYIHDTSEVGPNPGEYCTSYTPVVKTAVLALPGTPQITSVDYRCDTTYLIKPENNGDVEWYWQSTNSNGFSRNDSSVNYTVTTEDIYYLRALSTNGCWSLNSDSLNVEIRPTPILSFSDKSGCGSGLIELTANYDKIKLFQVLDENGNPFMPAITKTTSDSSATFGNLSAGNYKVNVSISGCSSTNSNIISIVPGITPMAPAIEDITICAPATILSFNANSSKSVMFSDNLSGTPNHYDSIGPVYSWDYTINNNEKRILYARAYDNNCYSEWISFEGTRNPPVTAPTFIDDANSPRCQRYFEETYKVTSTAAESYLWTIYNASPGTDYNIIGNNTSSTLAISWNNAFADTAFIGVKSVNSCGISAETRDTLIIYDAPIIVQEPIETNVCEGENALLKINAMHSDLIQYQWQYFSNTWNNIADGLKYSGTINDTLLIKTLNQSNIGYYRCKVSTMLCSEGIYSDTVNFGMLATPLNKLNDTIYVCKNQPIQLSSFLTVEGGSVPYQTKWINNSTQAITDVSLSTVYNSNSIFSVNTIDSKGCKDKDTVLIESKDNPEIRLTSDTIVYPGQPITLFVIGANDYEWTPQSIFDDPNSSTPTAIITEQQQIKVLAKDIYGCYASDSLTIAVNESKYYIPNAFTPNKDGKNDLLEIRLDGIASFDMQIYNRWGKLVFRTNDINKKWDGEFDGKKAGIQTVGYILKMKDIAGNETIKEGTITLFE